MQVHGVDEPNERNPEPETPREREREREFFIDNLLVRIHFIIVMIKWTGLAPWEFEFPFPGSLTSTFLVKPLTKCRFMVFTNPDDVWAEPLVRRLARRHVHFRPVNL